MFNLESQYLDLMNTVMVTGKLKENRTGVRTKSIQGAMLRHNSAVGFPLLTTKYVNFNSIVAELLWFLSGSRDCADLQKLGSNIWNKNAEAWNNIKPENAKYPKTYVGESYGHNWRNYGAINLDGRLIMGFDQIKNAIKLIKEEPSSRRIIVSAWDPYSVFHDSVCLPPCHCMFRFSVDQEQPKNTLNLSIFQRSVDLMVGAPFNFASYALLLNMVAQVTGTKPGQIVYFFDDVHIYESHFAQVAEQQSRCRFISPYEFPTLKLNSDIDDIDKFSMGDIAIMGYKHFPAIKAEMVV